MKFFEGFDLNGFWSGNDYERKAYLGTALTDELIESIENELGYKLPESYIEMMRFQNGGIPINTCHATSEKTSWAEDHITISGIYAIDRDKNYSLCGDLGSQFMMDEWGYPPIGVYFADCPSSGHDMLCLDYRALGLDGEPTVVHVDQEYDYKITFVAPSFESFIRGLRDEDSFPRPEEHGLSTRKSIFRTFFDRFYK
jgi:hypothetical protein